MSCLHLCSRKQEKNGKRKILIHSWTVLLFFHYRQILHDKNLLVLVHVTICVLSLRNVGPTTKLLQRLTAFVFHIMCDQGQCAHMYVYKDSTQLQYTYTQVQHDL